MGFNFFYRRSILGIVSQPCVLYVPADAAPIPAPNPVPPHSAGKDNDPSLPHPALHHAPIEKSHGKGKKK